MKNFWKDIKSAFYNIFPFVHSYIANKKIESRLHAPEQNEELDTIETLRDEYERSLKGKEMLEEKAKSNVVAVTISITLIMGASDIVNGLLNNPILRWMPYVAIGLVIGAVIYMVIAGTSAFQLLMDKNVVYYAASNTINAQEYYDCKESNGLYNIIRNNLLYTSYRCIKNALICLLLVLVMTLVNHVDIPRDPSGALSTKLKNVEIYYSSTVMENAKFTELRMPIESLVLEYLDSDKLIVGESTGLIDTKNMLFVKVYREGENVVRIVSTERYIP